MGTGPRRTKTGRKPIKVLVMHDNRTGRHTAEAHKLAKDLNKDPEIEVIADYDHWKRGEKTSKTETDRREAEMVKQADVGVRIAPSPKSTKQKRNDGAIREMQKLRNASKPI